MKAQYIAAGVFAAGIVLAGTAAPAAEPAGGLSPAACTADNAKAAGSAFTPLPGAGWSYALAEETPSKPIVEWQKITPPSPRSRHADRYEGMSPATATCIPLDASGKASPSVLSFKIAVGGEPLKLIGDDVVCVGTTQIKDYRGDCAN